MSLIRELEVSLKNSGVFMGWTDYYGEPHPEPMRQASIFNESEIGDNRCIFFRVGGGGYGNRYVSSPSATVMLVGLKDKSDSIIVEERAGQIKKLIMSNMKYCGIIGYSSVIQQPPVLTDSGRPMVIIDIALKVDNSIED